MHLRSAATFLAAGLLALAGCGSSPPGPVASVPRAVSTAPASTAPASTAPESAAPAPGTPVTTATTKPSKPLSRFEADAAVRALRAWARQAALTINKGKFDGPALDALMTPKLRRSMKQILGNSVGYRYPGPLPFTPAAVRRSSPTERHVDACFVTDGYALDPKTGKRSGRHHVTAIAAQLRRSDGVWRLDVFAAGEFSCRGVHIPTPPF